MKRIISLLLALTLMLGVLCACATTPAEQQQTEANQTEAVKTEADATEAIETEATEQDDALHITFRVTHDDGELKEFELSTTKSTLAEVLIDEDLVKESAESSGFYDTVDGEVADWNVDEGWWCFYCDGEALMVGIEETELVDGAVYEAVFTHGFG